MSFFASKEFWAALITVCGSVGAAGLAVYLGLRWLRETEIKRLRIKYISEMIAYRSILLPRETTLDEKTRFFSAMNAIPGLFGNQPQVMRLLGEFRMSQPQFKTEVLMRLIRSASSVSGLPLTEVSDADLTQPFWEEQPTQDAGGKPTLSRVAEG